MALHDFQVIFRNSSGLPRDDYVNTLHYEVNTPNTLGGVMDDIAACFTPLLTSYAEPIASMTIKAYAPGLNPGGPELTKNYAFNPTASPGPFEVAICLSYKSNDEGEPARRRGRIYIGPLAHTVMGTGDGRPSSTFRTAILDLGDRLASVGDLGNTTWRIYSRVDDSYHDIDQISVDDAWDTQRSRGLRPTLRTTRAVQ